MLLEVALRIKAQIESESGQKASIGGGGGSLYPYHACCSPTPHPQFRFFLDEGVPTKLPTFDEKAWGHLAQNRVT